MYSRLPADIEYDPNGFHHAWRGFPSVPKVYLGQVPLLESITRLMFGQFGVETQGAYSIKQCSVRRVGRKWHIMMEQIVMLDDAGWCHYMCWCHHWCGWCMMNAERVKCECWRMNDGWCMMDDAWWMMDDAWCMMHDGWTIDDWCVWLVCWLMDMTHSYDQGPTWWMTLWGISFGSLDEGLPWWKMMENQGLGWGINSQWCILNDAGWMMAFDECIINDEAWMTGRMIHPWLMNTCWWWWSWILSSPQPRPPWAYDVFSAGATILAMAGDTSKPYQVPWNVMEVAPKLKGWIRRIYSKHVSHSSESRNFLRVESHEQTSDQPLTTPQDLKR